MQSTGILAVRFRDRRYTHKSRKPNRSAIASCLLLVVRVTVARHEGHPEFVVVLVLVYPKKYVSQIHVHLLLYVLSSSKI